MVKGQTIKKLVTNLIVVAGVIISSCCLTSPVRAAETIIAPLKITEIYPNALNTSLPGGSETGFEFVEIANLSSSEVNLSQYGLRSKGKPRLSIFPVRLRHIATLLSLQHHHSPWLTTARQSSS